MECITKNKRTLTLGKNSLYVNPALTASNPEHFTYRSLHEAAAMIVPGTKNCPSVIYLEPDVYAMNGTKTSCGLTIQGDWISLIGLSENPQDTILADNRGHMVNSYPSDGFHSSPAQTLMVEGNGFHCENLTIGNYCNLDLVYPLDPKKNMPRYSDTITQAYAIGGYGYDQWSFENCHIIGMLDTISTRLERAYYHNCVIKGTKDFIGGAESIVFHECTIKIQDTCPMYMSGTVAALYKSCSFEVTLEDFDTLYLTKFGGMLILDHCSFLGNMKHIEWALEPEDDMRCYVNEVVCFDNPAIIGASKPQNTVTMTKEMEDSLSIYNLLSGSDEWNPSGSDILPARPIRIELKNPAGTSGSEPFSLSYQEESVILCRVVPFMPLERMKLSVIGPICCSVSGNELHLRNENKDTKSLSANVCLSAYGVLGCYSLTAHAKKTPQPVLFAEPSIILEQGKAILSYAFDCKDSVDESDITWFRIEGDREVPVAVSRTKPCRDYHLLPGDIGCQLKAVLYPKYQNSEASDFVTILSPFISSENVNTKEITVNDFSTFSLETNFRSGCFQIDTCHPSYEGVETEHVAAWEAGNPSEAFVYGRGRDGARSSYGLLTSARGCCLRYWNLPDRVPAKAMKLSVVLCPEKDTGEGFGSANGQFIELKLNYDPITKTGLGLRIERLPVNAVSCCFSLRIYKKGISSLLAPPVFSSAYLTPCTVVLYADASHITADITSEAQQMERAKVYGLLHNVHLEAPVPAFPYRDVEIHHTGTVPTGNRTLIEQLCISYLT